jgi:glycine cleavage system H protein
MSKPNPTDRIYSKDHEWLKDNGDGTALVGITDYAQEMLTDIVFVELPEIGKIIKQGDAMAVVESVKSVSDVYAPASGEIVETNKVLEETPELINKDAFGEGWLAKIKLSDKEELKSLMGADEYEKLTKEEKR